MRMPVLAYREKYSSHIKQEANSIGKVFDANTEGGATITFLDAIIIRWKHTKVITSYL